MNVVNGADHVSSSMTKVLNSLLNRPSNEKPYLILVAGYPAENCNVPDIEKKEIGEILTKL